MTSPVEQQLANALAGIGVSKAGIAGWLGNTQVESNFSPTAANPAEGAIGLQQWEGPFRTQLDQYAASVGRAETDPTAQIGFITTGLQGPYASLLADLRNATDPQAAAREVDLVYERSADVNSWGAGGGPSRLLDAAAIYGQELAGGLTASPSSSGTQPAGSFTANPAGSWWNPFDSGSWWDPLHWPANIVGGAAGAVEKGVLQLLQTIAKPLERWAIDAALVIFGVVFVIVGLRMIASAAENETPSTSTSSAPATMRTRSTPASKPAETEAVAEAA